MRSMDEASEAKKAFGRAVRAARLHKNLSQEELSDLAGLDRTYIGGVERGERNPSLISLHKIAKGLDTPLSHLFAGTEFDGQRGG